MKQDKALSVEELMEPRFKIIADYPGSHFPVGHITHLRPEQKDMQKAFENYPHLFKKLSWWEDRELGEMPEYVKNNYNGRVHRVLEAIRGVGIIDIEGKKVSFTPLLEPATEDQYNNFIKQKEKQ